MEDVKLPEVAIVDADVLRYEVGALTQEHPFLDTGRVPVDYNFMIERLQYKIDTIIARSGCSKVVFYFSEGGNFRFDVAKQQDYKANRPPGERPFHWQNVGDYIKGKYEYIDVFGREADDALAERQRRDKNTIICTRDKDLLITPGWHYRWACGERQKEVPPHYVSDLVSWQNFFYQMLIGDGTDNIPGCGERKEVMWGGKLQLRRQGIGKKAAAKLLAGVTDKWTMYHIVRMEYYKKFDTEDEEKMLENARLLFVGQTPEDLFDWSWLEKTWE
ncbi:exonuclease [Escherichia phage vB-EcoP-XT73]|nr:exonuclease [Escherichia phage vB-EcoP-XT73]